MKLGVFTPLFANLSLEEMLDKVKAAGLDAEKLAQEETLESSLPNGRTFGKRSSTQRILRKIY